MAQSLKDEADLDHGNVGLPETNRTCSVACSGMAGSKIPDLSRYGDTLLHMSVCTLISHPAEWHHICIIRTSDELSFCIIAT